jgi:hypothetical protein
MAQLISMLVDEILFGIYIRLRRQARRKRTPERQ